MPAFVQLPWLTGSDQFLKAMLSGGEAGVARERLAQQADESAGQIGLGYARLGADERQTAARLAQAQAEQSAQELYRQEELKREDQRIALSGQRLGAGNSPYQWMNLGNGEVIGVDKYTGQVTGIKPRREDEAVVTEPIYADEEGRSLAEAMGASGTTVRGTAGAVNRYKVANPRPPEPPRQLGFFKRLGDRVAAEQPQRFDSEEAAKAAGAQPGDVVYLRGVGKVRLK